MIRAHSLRVRELAGRLGLSVGLIPAAGFTATTGRKIRLIVLHDMEYPETPTGAEWCANYFAGRQADGTPAVRASAHYYTDNDSAIQGVDIDDVAWAAPAANHDGVQIEQAGYAGQTREQWLDPYSQAEMHNTAKLVACLCLTLNIPVRHLTAAQILAGSAGIVAHRDVNDVYHQSSHSDMGPNYPWDVLLSLVEHYTATLTQGEDVPLTPAEIDTVAEKTAHQVWTWLVTGRAEAPNGLPAIQELADTKTLAKRILTAIDGISDAIVKDVVAAIAARYEIVLTPKEPA